MRTWIGDLGHLFIIISFVASITATFGFFKLTTSPDLEKNSWKNFSFSSFAIHGMAVIGVIICLYAIISGQYYEYHYAWSHSSKQLPTHYIISCFWEGQEGSFLLWIFWHVLIGVVLLFREKTWTGPVMTVVMVTQVFLTSMILGVVLFNFKIGSSPFILLKDAMPNEQVFLENPDFIPEDGQGLNPLLQNYWMVIHPPTLFLGFALSLVPFSYCITGLWQKAYKEWIKSALPWTLLTALVLGAGIMMGGYWAYETLNFGGYWNWDPVENAVLIPWLTLIGSLHLMLIARKKDKGILGTAISISLTFLLVLYSTYLTRSGDLGDTSVHSFTDLGLRLHLWIFGGTFFLGTAFLVFLRRKDLGSESSDKLSFFDRELWIILGVLTLMLSALQVFAMTSLPVFNKLFGTNMAPPADQVTYYSNIQLWFATAVALLSGTGQFFYWQKTDKEKLWNNIILCAIISMLASSLLIYFSIRNIKFYLLVLFSVYSVVSNAFIFINLFKNSPRLTGGSLAHIGMATMFIGIIYSAGYSNTISKNLNGRDISENEDTNTSVLLEVDAPKKMRNYELVYKGRVYETKTMPRFLSMDEFYFTENDPFKVIAARDLVHKGDTFSRTGDTIEWYPENTYFEVDFIENQKDTFKLYPRFQYNEQMGNAVSPDIKKYWERDIYTHVTAFRDPDRKEQWGQPKKLQLAKGDTFFIKDRVAIFESTKIINDLSAFKVDISNPQDVAVETTIRILGKTKDFILRPMLIIKGGKIMSPYYDSGEMGVLMALEYINPENHSFTFSISTKNTDYIALKVLEKPHINLLWFGTILVLIGFGVAYNRRTREKRIADSRKKEGIEEFPELTLEE